VKERSRVFWLRVGRAARIERIISMAERYRSKVWGKLRGLKLNHLHKILRIMLWLTISIFLMLQEFSIRPRELTRVLRLDSFIYRTALIVFNIT